jgi:hypothetical protein
MVGGMFCNMLYGIAPHMIGALTSSAHKSGMHTDTSSKNKAGNARQEGAHIIKVLCRLFDCEQSNA